MISIIYEIGNAKFPIRFKNYGADLKARSAILCFITLIALSGCTGANYGSLKHSRDIAQVFETYHVWPQHRYYYLNQENNPYAVVALAPGYTISDNRWIEFDPQTDKLEKLVDLVRKFHFQNFNPHLHVLATDGCFSRDAAFMVCPPPDTVELEKLFRYEVFKMLKSEGKINDVVIEKVWEFKS